MTVSSVGASIGNIEGLNQFFRKNHLVYTRLLRHQGTHGWLADKTQGVQQTHTLTGLKLEDRPDVRYH